MLHVYIYISIYAYATLNAGYSWLRMLGLIDPLLLYSLYLLHVLGSSLPVEAWLVLLVIERTLEFSFACFCVESEFVRVAESSAVRLSIYFSI